MWKCPSDTPYFKYEHSLLTLVSVKVRVVPRRSSQRDSRSVVRKTFLLVELVAIVWDDAPATKD